MGMYDVVLVPCPSCGEEYQAQSKSGRCSLDYHKIADAPDDIMADVNRHAPFRCEKCEEVFEVELRMTWAVRALGRNSKAKYER